MLFNSIDFAIFLPVVFAIYWLLVSRNLKLQNFFLLVVSYIFYGWWDYRFLSLIVVSSVLDYVLARLIFKTDNQNTRKAYLLVSLMVNLGFLGFFKYYNFFADAFVDSFKLLGMNFSHSSLNIVLPVGISFYTFQTLSYTLDVYKRKLEPTNDIVAFFAFVSFFPQLVAGPIERASNLLPQFFAKRYFSYHKSIDGLRQILWGLFKKVVIADNCAIFVDEIFYSSSELSSGMLILGAVFFAFQIYGDFSGYSDIAIGTSRLFGFNLMRNFAYPYFSRDIAEFWRRWHISLSSWFRDYLYIPMGGSRGNTWQQIRNTIVVFVVSGFWHGANWTFVIWGLLNGLYFLPLMLAKVNRINLGVTSKGSTFPSIKEFIQMVLTFSLTCLAWIFFRANNIYHALDYIKRIFTEWSFDATYPKAFLIIPLILILVIVEWLQRNKLHGLQIDTLPKSGRYAIYYVISLCIVYLNFNNEAVFIYFQF